MATEAGIQAEDERLAEADRAIQRFLNRPRPRPTSPSPRQPDRSRHFNHADQIEEQMREDGHRAWGFIIYRTTYANDDEWDEFLRRLRFQMEDTFDGFNGRDILDLFTLTVIEDRQLLDGASTAIVREHFRQWRMTAPQSEQAAEGAATVSGIGPGRSPRYRYAIQVDGESLYSVVHDAPAPPAIDTTKKGWVKLIDASWEPTPSERVRYPQEPIEGVVENDVGWLKIPYQYIDEYYIRYRGLNSWSIGYRRPPLMMGWMANQ